MSRMSRKLGLALLFALVLPLSACLENEEEIEIRPDGSVEVMVRAQGKVADLSEGFPVPLDAPWQAIGAQSELWLRTIGPASGGAWEHERALEIDWPTYGVDPEKLELAARARFASVEEWPRFFAPADEPYREAYSERSASLRIERLGPYTAYTFERTFHARKRLGYDLFHTLVETTVDWPEDLAQRLETDEALTPGDWQFLARELKEIFARIYCNLATDALSVEDDGPYTRAFAAQVVEAVRARITALVTEERLMQVLSEMRANEERGEDDAEPLLLLEQEMRELLRATIRAELAAGALPDPVIFTALGRVEFGLTAADHGADLSGETFRITVKMPGTIVSGNYAALDEQGAHWEFEDDAFTEHDHVLRVVSIVE